MGTDCMVRTNDDEDLTRSNVHSSLVRHTLQSADVSTWVSSSRQSHQHVYLNRQPFALAATVRTVKWRASSSFLRLATASGIGACGFAKIL